MKNMEKDFHRVSSRAFELRNCFRSASGVSVALPEKQKDTYLSEEVRTDFLSGEHRFQVTNEYPVTQESVNSYVEASDYKNNPAAFISPRPNLGDVRDIQESGKSMVSGDFDLASFKAKIAELEARLKDLQKQKPVNEPVKAPDDLKKGGENNG